MQNGIKYKQFKLNGYSGCDYLFENGICFNCYKKILFIPEELLKSQNKNDNITENLKKSSGLINSGHSCFINAILQCFINCLNLNNYFLKKYKKTNYNSFSDMYYDFIIKYQQKDLYAARDIVNYFFSNDSTSKFTGSDSKDVLSEFFDIDS